MKHLKSLFIVLFCIFLSCATASAASAACKRPESAYSGTFRGVKAVSLAIMNHPGEFMELPPALDKKFLIDLFSSRIREHIMPYLEPNDECKIPDLVLFDNDNVDDKGYMWEFANRPDTLTIQLHLRHYMRPYKGAQGVFVLGFRYVRSGPSALKGRELLNWPEQVAFPNNEPVEAIEEHVTKLAGHIFILAPGSDTMNPDIGKSVEEMFKSSRPKPNDKWIPLPPPPEEKRPALDIVE
ncbi:MAG: hypothetical protein EPN97_02835 [Alphaproteobacteria bacterium]|nr:MAG: hypothetical protein EPN97_02835 [Alphaproteobacteria bacterium]